MDLRDFLTGKTQSIRGVVNSPGYIFQGDTPICGDPNLLVLVSDLDYAPASTWHMDQFVFYSFRHLVVGWDTHPVDHRPVTSSTPDSSNSGLLRHNYTSNPSAGPNDIDSSPLCWIAWWHKTTRNYGFLVVRTNSPSNYEAVANDGTYISETTHYNISASWYTPQIPNCGSITITFSSNVSPDGALAQVRVFMSPSPPPEPLPADYGVFVGSATGPDLNSLPVPAPPGGPAG